MSVRRCCKCMPVVGTDLFNANSTVQEFNFQQMFNLKKSKKNSQQITHISQQQISCILVSIKRCLCCYFKQQSLIFCHDSIFKNVLGHQLLKASIYSCKSIINFKLHFYALMYIYVYRERKAIFKTQK